MKTINTLCLRASLCLWICSCQAMDHTTHSKERQTNVLQKYVVLEKLKQSKQQVHELMFRGEQEALGHDLIDLSQIEKDANTTQKEFTVKNELFKENSSYFSYIPGSGMLNNMLSYIGWYDNYNNWERPLQLPNRWRWTHTLTHKNKSYAFLMNLDELTIYDINSHERRALITPEGKDFFYGFLTSNDGTCVCVRASTRNDQKKLHVSYLYNLTHRTLKRCEYGPMEGLRVPIADDNFMPITPEGSTKFNVYSIKDREIITADLQEPIKKISRLSYNHQIRSNNASSYIIVETEKGKQIIDALNPLNKPFKIEYKNFCKIIETYREIPSGYCMALVDDDFCILKAQNGEVNYVFKENYKGSRDISLSHTSWGNGIDGKPRYCAFYDDKQMIHICDITKKTITSIKAPDLCFGPQFQDGCEEFCMGVHKKNYEKESSEQTKKIIDLIFTTSTASVDFGLVRSIGWFGGDWFICANDKDSCYFIFAGGADKKVEHSGIAALPRNKPYICLRSPDLASAVVFHVIDNRLNTTKFPLKNSETYLLGGALQGRFESTGTDLITQKPTERMVGLFCGLITNKRALIYDALSGNIVKELNHDPKNPGLRWDANETTRQFALIKHHSIDIYDENFKLVTTRTYDEPISSAYFEQGDKVFKATTNEDTYFYAVNE